MSDFRVTRRGLLPLVLSLCWPGTVVAGQAASAAPVTPGSSGSVPLPGQAIAGRVLSAADGHPVPNAAVTLTVQQPRGGSARGQSTPQRQGALRVPSAVSNQAQTLQTDAEGRYRFPPQPAGRYTLRVSASGYLGMLYLEHENFSSAVVTGAGVSTDDLRFALVPEASIHGRVLDDTGEPVRAIIMLYRDGVDDGTTNNVADGTAQRIRPAGGAQADEDGRFEFSELRPGRYYVSATATPWYAVHAPIQQNEEHMPYRAAVDPALDVAYPITFYPHATTESGAVPIVLKSGQRAAANMLLQAEHAVTLTVQMPPADPAGQNGVQQFPALFHKVFGTDQGAGAQVSGRMGDTVVIEGVAPGQYTMRSLGRGGPQASGGTAVNLTGGSATVAMPAAPSTVSGDVSVALRTLAGAGLPDTVGVELQRVGARGVAPVAAKVEQGTAHFANLEPGDYRFRLRDEGSTWNVSRLTVGGKVIASKVLHVEGGTTKAEIVSTQYAPEVDGIVHAGDGKPHAGALVVLVPAGSDTGEDLYRADQSDLDGGFQFYGVLPGNYLLVAIDNNWQLHWHESSALMSYLPHAIPVTVLASGPRVVTLQEAAVAQRK